MEKLITASVVFSRNTTSSMSSSVDIDSSRRLSVADTLEQATKALHTHRAWMKRRISTAVAPIDPSESKNDAHKVNDIFTAQSREKTTLENIQEPPSSENPSSPAPPTFTSANVPKIKTSKVSPASLRDLPSLPVNNSLTSNGSSIPLNFYGAAETSTSSNEPEATTTSLVSDITDSSLPLSKNKRRSSSSKRKVTPIKEEIVDLATSPTEMFYGRTATRPTPHTPPTANLNAWGSMNPLEGDDQETTEKDISLMKVKNESDFKSKHSKTSVSPPESPNTELQDSSNTETVYELSPEHRCNDSESSSDKLDYLHNEEGSAVILPVSPAPKDQRSSYSLHTQSRVQTAEESLEIIDSSVTETKPSLDHLTSFNLPLAQNNVRRVKVGNVPEAILQPVLPKVNDREQNVVFVTRHKLATSPTTKDHQQIDLKSDKLESLDAQTATPTATESSINNINADTASNLPQTTTKSTSSASLSQQQDSEANPPKIASKGGPPSLPTNAWNETAEIQTLRELKLPLLKDSSSVDGSDLVMKLPPLKIMSPLTPHGTGFTFSRKRDRAPPPYTIHRPRGSLGLAPPCPAYGVTQPKESDVHLSTNLSVNYTDSSFSQPPTTRDSGLSNRQPHPLTLHKPPTPLTDHSAADGQSISIRAGDHDVSLSGLSTGPSPLHLAAKSGNLRRLQALVNQGHDVDLPDQEGRTPLMYCIHSQGVHLSCADALIREGANVNKQSSDGSTAMHLASSVGAVALIELMILNGADPDVRDFEGRLPLHWSTIQKSTKVISSLIENSDLDVNVTDDSGMTPLMWSAYHNNHPITSFLLEHGADCEEKDTDGYTAMHWGVHRDSTQCLQLLLKPDMTYFKDHRGKTVILFAAEKGAMTACELILKMRPDAIYDTEKMGRTPLHYAAACSRVDVCALLLDRGADAAQRDSTGRTPLDYARLKKMDYVVALLTCHGTAVADFARASRSTSVSSFLHHAISFSHLPGVTEEVGENEKSKSLTSLQYSHQSKNENKTTGSLVSLRSDRSLCSEDVSGEGADGVRSGDGVNVLKGGYLGRFVNDKKDPVQHFYFRLNPDLGTVSWAHERSAAQKTAKHATILEVHEGPSNGVKQTTVYSPESLHKHVFWIMTAGGILDLFAYHHDDYTVWVREASKIAETNSQVGDVGQSLRRQERIRKSGIASRPSSSQSTTSRGKVAPENLNRTFQERITQQTTIEQTPQTPASPNDSTQLFISNDTKMNSTNTLSVTPSKNCSSSTSMSPLSGKRTAEGGNRSAGFRSDIFITSTPVNRERIEQNDCTVSDII